MLAANREWRRWALAINLVRLPTAMAPLALLLAAGMALGSLAQGGLLVGAYSFGEVLGAPVAGRALDRLPLRGALKVMFGVEAAALAALVVAVASGVALAPLAAIALITGAAPSAVPGALRTLLEHILDAEKLEAALGADATLLEVVYALAPALVALLSPAAGGTGALLGMTAAAVIAAAATLHVASSHSARQQQETEVSAAHEPFLRGCLSVFAASAALGIGEGMLVVTLPSLLHDLNISTRFAGPLIALFALASILGGAIYTKRLPRWPGSRERRGDALLLALTAGLLALAASPTALITGVTVALTGLTVAPLNAVRAAELTHRAPRSRHSQAFSLLSAIMTAGYSLAGLLLGVLLTSLGARGLLILAAALTATGALSSILLRTVRTPPANSTPRSLHTRC